MSYYENVDPNEKPDKNNLRQKDRNYLYDLKEEIEELNLKNVVSILQRNDVPMLQKITVYNLIKEAEIQVKKRP